MHLENCHFSVSWQESGWQSLLVPCCLSADPHFFSVFGLEDSDWSPVLLDLSHDPETDYFLPLVAKVDALPLGLLFAYPLSTVFSKQLHSLKSIISFLSISASVRTSISSLSSAKATLSTADSLYLSRLYVHPSARGKGLGKLLLQAYERYARDRQHQALALHVRAENKIAQELYLSLGFSFVGCESAKYLGMEKLL